MADTVHNSFIALPIISLFEIFMIVRWILIGRSFSNPGDAANMGGYIALLCASLLTLGVIGKIGKNIEKNHQRIYVIETIYAVVIVLWTLWLTYAGSTFNGYFDYLVYVTIVIIVPVFCFISPAVWAPIQLASAAVILTIASRHNGFSAFLINFSVFTIISILASGALYRLRYTGYQKQIALEAERDQNRYQAYHNALTGLGNRRCYVEKLEKLDTKGLTLAMFDVNGLKQVNDNLGHEAGDELIKGAAECLEKAFSDLGTIYRVGGDEYTGIFHGTGEQINLALQHLDEMESGWCGKLAKKLSISVGIAMAEEHPGASIKDLETIADDAMYADKKEHYKRVHEGQA